MLKITGICYISLLFLTLKIFINTLDKLFDLKSATGVNYNASFHKSSKIKELIESYRCRLLFLPPYYSPDFNPIEKY